MSTAKVPLTFKDRKQLIHAGFDLMFPGYGLGFDISTNTDDGSRLQMTDIEIPRRDKSRYLVVHEASNHLDLIDDFVASTATNAVTRAKLESGQLFYYNDHDILVRQKSLEK